LIIDNEGRPTANFNDAVNPLVPKLFHDFPSKYASLKRDHGHEWVKLTNLENPGASIWHVSPVNLQAEIDSQSKAQFCVKCSHFRYISNKGRSWIQWQEHISTVWPRKPQFLARICEVTVTHFGL